MKTNKRKGISLIVLIITIVVIIILAVAVILTINKNNPIESAKKATFLSDISSYQDELSMQIGLKYIDSLGEFDVSDLDGKALEEVITINSKYNEKFAIKDGKIVGTDGLTDQEKEWAESVTGGATGSVTPQAPSNYTDTDGNKAYIPTGFSVSTVESEKKIDTGLVIKDSKGNEFVWIPVEYTSETEFTSKFVLKDGYSDGRLQDFLKDCTEPYSDASQSEKDEYNAMIESVKKYHGYYIARYEASQDVSGNAQSIPNAIPWTNIRWANSMTNLAGGAVEKSRAIHPLSLATEGSAVSTLCYGIQWDIALDYIENYGIQNATYRKDSTAKGNYNSSKINTGSNTNYALNNIYDMAGNVHEWTMQTNSGSRVGRGGYYSYSGINLPVSFRGYNIATRSEDFIGFRIALYIK